MKSIYCCGNLRYMYLCFMVYFYIWNLSFLHRLLDLLIDDATPALHVPMTHQFFIIYDRFECLSFIMHVVYF